VGKKRRYGNGKAGGLGIAVSGSEPLNPRTVSSSLSGIFGLVPLPWRLSEKLQRGQTKKKRKEKKKKRKRKETVLSRNFLAYSKKGKKKY